MKKYENYGDYGDLWRFMEFHNRGIALVRFGPSPTP